jgi:DNA-directed RNA polymerase subunit RPC12/RpoP
LENGMIRFSCLNCGKPLRVDDNLAGKGIECRHCSSPQEVPYLPENVQLPATKKSSSGREMLLPIVRAVVWSVFVLVALVLASSYSTISSRKEISAIQQAALAADACFWLILWYGIARAIDSVTRWRS